jgi:hypothetical protein
MFDFARTQLAGLWLILREDLRDRDFGMGPEQAVRGQWLLGEDIERDTPSVPSVRISLVHSGLRREQVARVLC